MKNKSTNTLLFILITIKCFSQDQTVTLQGKLIGYNSTVIDAHIINLNKGFGSISDDEGEFEINAAINDTLLISSIQYKRKKVRVTQNHINSKKIYIKLTSLVNILDEVYIHGLTGNLEVDMKTLPKDTVPKMNFVFRKSDLNKILPPDDSGILKPPNAQDITDPIKMNGVGAGATIPNFALQAELKLKRELKNKKDVPVKIIQELGEDFFTKSLKIHKDSIHLFLTYCENRNIIEIYNDNNLLEVIKILREESEKYHEIKN